MEERENQGRMPAVSGDLNIKDSNDLLMHARLYRTITVSQHAMSSIKGKAISSILMLFCREQENTTYIDAGKCSY